MRLGLDLPGHGSGRAADYPRLKVLELCEQLIVEAMPVLDKIPRCHRYRYGTRLESALFALPELVVQAASAASIVGGFASSALGAPHTYDSALEDQLNLIGAVSLGADLPYRCADAAGIKAFHLHTAAQLKQVAADGALVKLTALEKAATLKAQVQAAADAAAVEAAAW